jgi:probable H4MPT-linked C1 transfer pathway protein
MRIGCVSAHPTKTSSYYVIIMNHDAIGLDIGGANIKAATASARTWSRPFELWRHPEHLADELAYARVQFDGINTVAVTMTGELCDCFPTKRDGVRHILAAVQKVFASHAIRVWTTDGTFQPPEAVIQQPMLVAAANWLATATLAARMVPRQTGLLIDTGSTTTDIIPLSSGQPTPMGRTDPERLASGELVYTGAKRTPVCALLGEQVAAEWFATTHDVYVRLGLLPEEPNNSDTADKRPMTMANAHARLSRMLCGDPEITSEEVTMGLAQEAYEKQRSIIVEALNRVANRLPAPPSKVILAGSGEFLAKAAWSDFATKATTVHSLSEELGAAVSEAACAYAVATLAAEL